MNASANGQRLGDQFESIMNCVDSNTCQEVLNMSIQHELGIVSAICVIVE